MTVTLLRQPAAPTNFIIATLAPRPTGCPLPARPTVRAAGAIGELTPAKTEAFPNPQRDLPVGAQEESDTGITTKWIHVKPIPPARLHVLCRKVHVRAALLRVKEALTGLKPWAGGWATGLAFKSAKAIAGSFLPTDLGMLAGLQGDLRFRSSASKVTVLESSV